MSKNYAIKVVKIAKNEVGYLEKATNSQLDSKTANAGYNDWNKFARDLDQKYPNFLNGKKNGGSGYWWCAIFVIWCFVEAYGEENAHSLLSQPEKSMGASCTACVNYYKAKGQWHDRSATPKVGDQIIFQSNGSPCHTGIVTKVDNTYVYTVEGNTTSAAGVVANGGCVAEKKYLRTSTYIYGYGRPKYDKESSAVKTKKKCALYPKAWHDPLGKAVVSDGVLGVGVKVTFIKDDSTGWSQVKFKGEKYWAKNGNLDKSGLSKYPKRKTTEDLKAIVVAKSDKKKGDKVTIHKGKKFFAICYIESGKYKGYYFAKTAAGNKYYIKSSLTEAI
jgi:hypothetical protein